MSRFERVLFPKIDREARCSHTVPDEIREAGRRRTAMRHVEARQAAQHRCDAAGVDRNASLEIADFGKRTLQPLRQFVDDSRCLFELAGESRECRMCRLRSPPRMSAVASQAAGWPATMPA
jgi:hypothetical protein